MKSLRVFFALLSLLLLVVLFILISLQLLIDPNKLKPIIISEVKKQTGYDLLIDGNLSWSFYPLFSVKVKRMTLAKPNEKVAFLELDKVNLGTPLGKIIFRSFHRNDLSGYLDVDDIKYNGIHARQASLRFLFSKQTLTLMPIYANFYGGTLHADLYASNLESIPKWSGKIELNNVNLQSLLIDLKALNKINMIGIFKLTFIGDATGKVDTQLAQNLNGTMTFQVAQGKLFNIDLNYLLESAKALIKREALPTPPASLTTPFNNIQGGAFIKQGLATLQNTWISTTSFKAQSSGTIDLRKQVLDLHLQITPLDTVNAPWQIPVIIRGNMEHPTVSLDMDEINKMMVNLGVEKIKEKAKEEIQKHLPGEVQNLIQKLLSK